MNEQELNKKLAEWAGFVFDEGAEYGIPPVFGLWYSPDNDQIGYPEPPQFTQSLDACFKLLVPKLDKARVLTNDAPSGDRFYNGEVELYSIKATVTSDTPTLALCLAIEKLIDAEVGGE